MNAINPGDTGHGGSLDQLLCTMEELQRILGCGKTTAFSIVGSGAIESVQIGRKRMPVVESVRAYVERLREQAKEQIAA